MFSTTSSITGVLCNHLGELGHGVAILLSSALQPPSAEDSGEIWLWKRKQPLQKVLEFRKLIFLGAALWGVQGAEGEAGPTAYVLGLASAPRCWQQGKMGSRVMVGQEAPSEAGSVFLPQLDHRFVESPNEGDCRSEKNSWCLSPLSWGIIRLIFR